MNVCRFRTRAIFALIACLLTGCAGGTTPPTSTATKSISGVYDGVIKNFDGRGDARVGFSFDEKGGTVTGAVRILPPISSPWRQHRYKAHHSVDTYSANDFGAQLSGHAALGSDIGTFKFTGTIASGVFAYSYKDAVGSGTGTARWEAPYVQAGSAVSIKTVRAMSYAGAYTVNLGPVNVVNPFTLATCAPVNANGITSVPMTITTASADGFGGIALTGQFAGPLGYVGGTGPYAFSDDPTTGQTAEIWGFWTTIDQTYLPVSSPGIYEFVLSIGGWNAPPTISTYGEWQFKVNAAQICQGSGPFTSVTST